MMRGSIVMLHNSEGRYGDTQCLSVRLKVDTLILMCIYVTDDKGRHNDHCAHANDNEGTQDHH